MNKLCEICEDEEGKILCKNCTKMRRYCLNCFKITHKTDIKKSHKTELLDSVIPDNYDEFLCCPTHPKEIKKYICLDCQLPICSECGVIGEHAKHECKAFEDGVSKAFSDFTKNLDEYKDFIKKLSELKEIMIPCIQNKIKWFNDLEVEIKAEFNKLRDIIAQKEKEILNIIILKVEEYAKLNKSIIEINEKSRITLDKNIKIIDMNNFSKIFIYEEFVENENYIKESRAMLKNWVPFIDRSTTDFPKILSESVIKPIIDCQLTNSMLVSKIFYSNVVKNNSDINLLKDWILEASHAKYLKIELLWRGSVDGFASSVFHSKCDNKGPTLTIITSESNYVFGGYTTQSWCGNNDYCYDESAFIYSLNRREKYAKQNNKSSIYRSNNYGPVFGSGHDICTLKNCNCYNANPYSNNRISYNYDLFSNSLGVCNVGSLPNNQNENSTYEVPSNLNRGSYFPMPQNVKLKEIEVYSVKIL